MEKKDNRFYIKEFARLENEEIEKTLLDFPNEETWMIEIFKLIQFFEKSDLRMGTKWRTSILLSQVISKEILLCFLSFLRKHTSQAYSCMRSAIEAAGFMNAIRIDEKKARIWMKKPLEKEDEEFKKLQRERWIGDFGQTLKPKYKLASEMCHPNLFKTVHWTKSKLDKDNKRIIDSFSFFDEFKNKKIFRSTMNYLIGTCFNILELYCDVFAEAFQKNDFKNKINEKFDNYKKYLQENVKDIISNPELLKSLTKINEKPS